MLNMLNKYKICFKDLEIVGCDGCPTNTGKHAGIIRLLELKIGKPVQQAICLLHCNELPLRQLFFHLDGASSGPNSFTGPIGKQLANAENLSVVDGYWHFQVSYFPRLDNVSHLSKDQQQLYRICSAFQQGSTTDKVFSEKIGPLFLSRWMTLATRTIKVSASQKTPSPELQALVKYILYVYAPLWFDIRLSPYISEGPKHFYRLIQRTRDLFSDSPNLLQVTQKCLQRNGFMAHNENITIAMLNDDDPDVKEKGFLNVLQARANPTIGVRKFEVPKINFNANHYTRMIDWSKITLTEPPLLRNVPSTEIKDFQVPKYLCHTQPVERHVHIVTQAAATVCGEDERHGFILSKLEFHLKVKNCETKSDFKALFN